MTGAIEMSHLFMQANAALVETLLKALQGATLPPPPVAYRVSSAVQSHSATRQLISGCPTLMCLCDSEVCRRKS